MEAYLNAAISGNTENLPKPISRIDFLLCELIKTLGESGASIEEVEKIVTDKVAEIVADAPEDFDTLKELSDWIYTHEESAAAMNTAIQSNTNSIESLMTDVNKKANSDDVYDKVTADSRFLGIDATADKAVADENGSNISETFSAVKNSIALNRTTLGTQCKNLFDWKNATYSTSLRLTQTKTESGISVTSTGSWAITAYKLPILEVGTAYIFSTTISDLSVAGGKAYVVISTSTSSSNIVKAVEITNNGTATIKFEATSNTMYVLFYPNYSDTVYTNSFTASNIMLRYADITDDTYEPYKENIDERLIKNKSDIAVNKTTLGTQCKNLLKNTAVTKTVNGVTFTVNDDKSITVSGTNNSSYTVFFNVCKALELTLEKDKSYIMTGCPENNKSSDNKMLCYLRVDSSTGVIASDTGNGVTFTTSETSNPNYAIICINANAELTDPVIFYPMIRYADITDDTYESYKESVDERLIENKSNAALNRTTLGTQCKNLLKNTAVTTTINGVTFTVNNDKSITVSGINTSSSSAYIQLCGLVDYGNSKLIASIGQNTTDVYMAIYDSDWNWIGTGSAGTISFENSSKKRLVRLVVKPGVTINNVTVYPMLRYADITDDTYEPYKENMNERLIKNKSDIAVNKSTLGYQRKNLLKPTSSITRAGITYTVNEDGSVTLTGTSTTGSTYNYFSIPITLKPGKYKVNGMPETSKTTTYRTDLRATESGGITYGYGVKEFEVEFTETTTAYYMIRIDGSYKESLNGITFYPMIRYADIADSTYEPYQPSLQEQIEALEARIAALEV